MSYPTYLVHFNQNHDKRNGQFTYGDGDGDGISNDHAHRAKGIRKVAGRIKNGVYDSPGKTVGQQRVSTVRKKAAVIGGAVTLTALIAGGAILINKLSKSEYNDVNNYYPYEEKGRTFIKDSTWDSIKLYDSAAIWDDPYAKDDWSSKRRWTYGMSTNNFVKDGYWHQ